MKKMSWGTKLGIGASIYVIGVLAFVGFSTTQKINLVSKDYYPKEVEYQKQIDKLEKAKNLNESIQISQKKGKLQFQFPKNMHSDVSGEIILYRPADYESDLKYTIQLDTNGYQEIESDQLLKGKYTVQIDWVHQQIGYYMEEGIYLSK
ncbi:FixH family protein [Labilibaculum sp. DW002]|uniref:FixH family protein n=1 Tax=Paralabilibaculum antarcticum TaxID=2912572 RepID=A0ABT5VS10_9BACT|nr:MULTISPECIES: FixH family protein [unclassified Labilibaculum]MBI9056345.1 FixH family protein [Labilibaculum sp.]MDE5418221.1 FixH family protein [Labilibaculum sp. DW002]